MIIFCRHGETVFNQEDRFQGVSDSPLTAKGIDQARKISHFLQSHQSLKFCISPLPRVWATFKHVCAGTGYVPEVIADLREISYGEWETLTKEQIKQAQHHLWQQRLTNRFTFVHPGSYFDVSGESYLMLYQRIVPLITRWLRTANPRFTTVVISHLGVMRCVQKYFHHYTDEQTSHLEVPNHQMLLLQNNRLETVSL